MVKIAFPGTKAGLEGELIPHFGRTSGFVVVELETDGKSVKVVEHVENPPHQEGGCMQPVMLLKEKGVTHVVLGGIGQRPLMNFVEVGIDPYRGVQGTVQQNLDLFLQNQLTKMAESTCNH